ncbi:DapH/DapD/GlmU-related protein [Deminuibacter soli]|uniref:Acetyltransferase n=1 Tax=Deminuibacter soli TaxID=2291815 RepID=A0A3E1NFK8_9BACT|nr:DapH/DapD/GlmU-related protein [Deminuibacter soli]RFM26662.1 acetyltransferase [Deminuibacter soli]
MLKRYGLFGALRVFLSLVYTKIFFPQARLIRVPFDIRNRKFIRIGKDFTTGYGCRIEVFPRSEASGTCMAIGDNVQINDYVHISAVESLTIGNNVLIASKVFISDHNHGSYTLESSDSPLSIPANRPLPSKPVRIEDNVWIGESVCVLPGVTIGAGCVIGALSVVTRSIPPYSIAVGSPAKVVKVFNMETQVWESV